MNIYFDGILYSWIKNGGVVRYFDEIISRIGQTHDATILLHTPHFPMALPAAARTLAPLRFRRMFPMLPHTIERRLMRPLNRFALEQFFSTVTDGVFHSTYYTTYANIQIPQVVTVHDMTYEKFPQFFNSAGAKRFMQQKKESILAADRIVCVSETTKRDVLEYYGLSEKNMRVIHQGVSSAFHSMPENVVQNTLETQCNLNSPYILFVGKRDGYKNFSILLNAFAQWKLRREYTLVVTGDSWSAAEAAQIEALQLKESILNTGRVSDFTLNALYNGACAFVYPSLYEGFGLPLLEARACGTPVIAADIPVFREIADDHTLFFDPNDSRALADMLTNGVMMPRYVDNAAALTYNWETTARETEQIYIETYNAQ